MLNADNTAVVLVDVQERLVSVIHEKERLVENARKLVQGAKVLGVPVLCSEQYPKGLGPTVPELRELLDADPVEKISFSCCGEPAFVERLKALGRPQVLLAGIESHVCVYQTAADLLAMGYEVQVVVDAISSRAPGNHAVGIEKMKDAGAKVTSVEAALFELLKVAKGDIFKGVARIVK